MGNSKTRCTVSLTITADGEKLKPMIIFKGQRGGTIATRELAASQYRDNMVLSCQTNAWQDEENMNDWVDGVLVPHLQQHAVGSPVYLFLDQFAAHDTASFRTRMDSLGVTLKLIPGKCTWVLQPIDVGIGKPFKDRRNDTPNEDLSMAALAILGDYDEETRKAKQMALAVMQHGTINIRPLSSLTILACPAKKRCQTPRTPCE
ncbi:DDE superfamily endonuclease [Nitzschia inconspicua]|uniref:DDE superfamily endonuclease n=1 Tax=Nitzschia inconspicua TaxID=303405 RepID=A0A9K3LTX3_9STRA|nr:DDE superfamily endonuclease [Nitzschia inconspicua]KAG7367830.1 DDE superfamily endonuclease [Nitzschia inconspicua]